MNHLDNGALHHEQHLTVDVWIVVCDGLTGPPDAIAATWPLAIPDLRAPQPFKLASRRGWDAMAGELRPIYTGREAAKERLGEFHQQWGETYPAIIFLWTNAWTESAPFVDNSPEMRRVICSTNAIESLHARFRRATRARGIPPTSRQH